MQDWPSQFNSGFFAHFDSFQSNSKRLHEAIAYAIEQPGKRLRPLFVEEASRLVLLPEKASKLLGYALEMIHLFSLVHDDLPCLDDDDFRRGQPTVHKKFDEPTALLAGDALMALAHETFAEILPEVNPENFKRASLYFSKAIGMEGMIGGQALEFELSNQSSPLSLEDLIRIQDLKTGALFKASMLIPLILMGKAETDPLFIEVQKFARAFGFAFQVADDLDDHVQDEAFAHKNILSFMSKHEAIQRAVSELNQATVADSFSAKAFLVGQLQIKNREQP